MLNKIFKNNRVIAIAFLTVFTTGVSLAAHAGGEKPVVPVEMKFAGLVNQHPVFEMKFSGNAEQNQFTISIRDEYGNVLYRENIKGETFSKKFMLNTDEIEDNTLIFEVFCNKTKKQVSFEVNRHERFVQDIAINEVQ